jgi:DNA polymerase-3 subunit epsilon
MKFYNETECRNFLEKLCEQFELCPKYCHLQSNVATCFHYQIKQCKGICRNEEDAETYNKRVQQAIQSVQFNADNFVIKEKGRTNKEYSFALILNGIYKGYGFISKRKQTKTTEDYLKMLSTQKDNNDIRRILTSYLKKEENTIEKLSDYSPELNSFELCVTKLE